MRSQKQPTLVHKPRFTAGEVVGLEGVDVVEVFKLVMAIRPSRIPSTWKGMNWVQKSHGLALIRYCLTTMAGNRNARLVLGHPTPLVMRTLFQPRLWPVVLARTKRTLPVCRPQFLVDLPKMVDAYLSPHQACPPHLQCMWSPPCQLHLQPPTKRLHKLSRYWLRTLSRWWVCGDRNALLRMLPIAGLVMVCTSSTFPIFLSYLYYAFD